MSARILQISPKESSPPYLQVADGLRREILGGILAPDSRLPSVRDLALELNIAPGTVKAAYRLLIEQGLLRASMMGTWVSAKAEVSSARKRAIDASVGMLQQGLLDKGFTQEEVRASFRRTAAREAS